MQFDPDITGFTGPIGQPGIPLVPNIGVGHLLSLTGSTLIGSAFFDRTKPPQAASAFGRNTDSWHWTQAGSEWPSVGFRLRIRTNPPFKPHIGDYAIWTDQAFTPTTQLPPTVPRFRIVRESDQKLLGELRVVKEGSKWRQTWWSQASVLTNKLIEIKADVDYRFEPMSGPSALNPATLHIVEHGLTSLTKVTPG